MTTTIEALTSNTDGTSEQRHIYRLVPAGTRDIYAAGFDGNKFDSIEDAEATIAILRAVSPEYDHDWEVIEWPVR